MSLFFCYNYIYRLLIVNYNVFIVNYNVFILFLYYISYAYYLLLFN
jgi:hypothetical protein